MGWCTGSHICNDIWRDIREYVPEDKRAEVLGKMVNIFSDEDADCWGDVMYDFPEYREAMKIADIYDLYFDDEEDENY